MMNPSVFFRNVIQNLLEFIYPPLCVVCDGQIDANDTLICSQCWSGLKSVKGPVEYGILERSHIDEIRSGFYYDNILQSIIHYLKYNQAPGLAKKMAELVAPNLVNHPEWARADALIPIPLHKAKARERGYNQAEVIARHLSKLTGIPFWPDALIRKSNTVSQTKMKNAQDRIENMKNVFEIRCSVREKSLILIDDVITTGATANACAQVLKHEGAHSVYVLSVARPIFN